MNDHHIIESIGSWGVVSTRAEIRLYRVKGGDVIEVPEELRRYPCTSKYSRIANISADGIASVCEAMGSAHLLKDGSCDISGGPWWGIPIKLLQPTYQRRAAWFWNWGNNSPGAAQGIHYHIERPVHRLTWHPDDLKQRYGKTEPAARQGSFMHETPLDAAEWEVFMRGRDDLWVFRRITPTPPPAAPTDTAEPGTALDQSVLGDIFGDSTQP